MRPRLYINPKDLKCLKCLLAMPRSIGKASVIAPTCISMETRIAAIGDLSGRRSLAYRAARPGLARPGRPMLTDDTALLRDPAMAGESYAGRYNGVTA